MLDQLVGGQLFGLLLVFARIGAAFVLLPGFGEAYVPVRYRLLLAVAITVVLAPALAPDLPGLPSAPVELLPLLGGEIAVGLFLGLVVRLTLVALHTAGMIIAYQSSLANALTFDPASAQQGALTGAWLTAIALVLIFITDLHHLMLRSLADSYAMFRPGALPPVGDFAEAMVRITAESVSLGVRIAAPLLVFGLIFFLALGLLARLMPQLQVFFIAMPLQIALGLLVLGMTIAAIMLAVLDSFEETLRALGVAR
ncbi:MAG: flagellar biosynthetic protein FliR [Pseudomonadota bacterium]